MKALFGTVGARGREGGRRGSQLDTPPPPTLSALLLASPTARPQVWVGLCLTGCGLGCPCLSVDISFPVWTLGTQQTDTSLLRVSLPPCHVGQSRPDLCPLAQNQLDMQRPLVTESVKRAVVSIARDSWEVYFSRLFPATVRAPCLPPARPGAPGMRPEEPHVPLVPTPGQRGHRRADPSCVPHGHQTPAHGQGQPRGRWAASGPAHVQVTGGWAGMGLAGRWTWAGTSASSPAGFTAVD